MTWELFLTHATAFVAGMFMGVALYTTLVSTTDPDEGVEK